MFVDSCQALGRSCQHLNFCFPGKTEHFYWLRTKELCWEACAVSFNFFFIFLSSSLTFLSSSYTFAWIFSAAPKMLKNSNVLDTLPERDISWSLFLNPYNFIILILLRSLPLKEIWYAWYIVFASIVSSLE